MTFQEALGLYMNEIQVLKSDGTYRFNKDKATILIKYMGAIETSKIDRKFLIKLIVDQRIRNPEISNKSINMYINLIKRVLKNQCNRNIEFEKLKEVSKVIDIVPEDIIRKVFNYYERSYKKQSNLRNYLIFRILLETGIRFNELINLRIHNIDLDLNSITVRITKTKDERYVFFSAKTKRLLSSLTHNREYNDFLFILKDSNQMTYEALHKMNYRLKKRLEIKVSISPHKWRHTFATNYIKNGGDTASLQKLLGHKNLKTTERYLHLNFEDLRTKYNQVMLQSY